MQPPPVLYPNLTAEAIIIIIRTNPSALTVPRSYLVKEFNVLRNVMLSGLKLCRHSRGQVEERAMEHLRTLGMHDHALKRPNQLSGGQKQRVTIARALINDLLIIMGDEPTGNLDKHNSDLVFDIFRSLAHEQKQTLLVVTHDPNFAARTDRTIEMEDVRIILEGEDNQLIMKSTWQRVKK